MLVSDCLLIMLMIKYLGWCGCCTCQPPLPDAPPTWP